MANEEHVVKLKEGARAWNKWRKENPDVRPDLSDADLHGADLCGADLRLADLRLADLRLADLRWAYLRLADLRLAHLRWADLTRADLRWAYLAGADLSDVKNLTVEQLCQAKTLYKAIMASTLEAEVKQKCPELFDEPE